MNTRLFVVCAIAVLLAVAGAASGKPDVPECSDLFANMLLCSGIP